MKKNLIMLLIAASTTVMACGDSSTTETTTDSATNATTMNDNAPAMEPGVMVGGANMVPSKNIVENAAASSEHTKLVAAVQTAGLAETLSGTGPFTVFAPTNAAFDKLPQGTVETLLTPEKKGDLTSILTYHVVAGSVKAADLTDGQKVKTLQGEELTVSIKDGKVMINGANVTTADVISSNGVTHVIDGVLTPKGK